MTRIRASNLVLFGPFTKEITPKRRQEEEQRLLAFCIQIGAPNITAIEHIYRHFNTWKRNIKEMIARRQKKTGIGKQINDSKVGKNIKMSCLLKKYSFTKMILRNEKFT